MATRRKTRFVGAITALTLSGLAIWFYPDRPADAPIETATPIRRPRASWMAPIRIVERRATPEESDDNEPVNQAPTFPASLSGALTPPRAYRIRAAGQRVECNEDGRFLLEGLASGPLRLVVLPPATGDCNISGVTYITVDLAPGPNSHTQEIGTPSLIDLTATFQGRPVEDLGIEVVQRSGGSITRLECRTDPSGAILFSVGDGAVELTGFGFEPVLLEPRQYPQKVIVRLDALPAFLEGVVTVRGEPLQGAVVMVQVDEDIKDAQATDQDGYYRTGPVAGGPVTAYAYLEAERARTQDGAVSFSVRLEGGQTQAQDFDFDREFRTVSGILTHDEIPMAGVSLELWFAADSPGVSSLKPRPTLQATTNDAGRFGFLAIEGDVVEVQADGRALTKLLYVEAEDIDLRIDTK